MALTFRSSSNPFASLSSPSIESSRLLNIHIDQVSATRYYSDCIVGAVQRNWEGCKMEFSQFEKFEGASQVIQKPPSDVGDLEDQPLTKASVPFPYAIVFVLSDNTFRHLHFALSL